MLAFAVRVGSSSFAGASNSCISLTQFAVKRKVEANSKVVVPQPSAKSCQLNLQYDAAIFPLNDRIGTDIGAIAAQILSCPQIKRAIVKRTQDGCSTDEAVGKRSPPMRTIRLCREYLARVGEVNGDVSTVHLKIRASPLGI